jgi:hypothetical protein
MSHAGCPIALPTAVVAVAVIGAAVCAAPAAAQVYRCEQDGVVRYADKPCERGARPVELPPAIVVPAGPQADLLEQAERRKQAQRKARDAADGQWLQAHEARKSEEERLRSGRVTRTVVEGMAPDDVRRIHGDPPVVSTSQTAKGPRETWSYALDGGTRLHVTFTNGRVSSVRTREDKP